MLRQPDIEKGRAFIRDHPAPGRILLCGLTGSHFYGFPAPDSDLDLKGIHLVPLRQHLGLNPPEQTHDVSGTEAGLLCDLTTNEAGLAIRLLLKGNGNMLERLFSPCQLFETEELQQLRDLAPAYLSKRVAHHYKGFFQRVCEEHLKVGKRRIKSMLYAYRTALTGAHLLNNNEVVGDLRSLAPVYGFREILDIIVRYQSSSEKEGLSPSEDAFFQSRWPMLASTLDGALDVSRLPDDPSGFDQCSEWLVELRLMG